MTTNHLRCYSTGMRALFIHRSVGQNMLDHLESEHLDNNVTLHDFNANYQRLRDSRSRSQLVTSIHMPNGNTDPGGLVEFSAVSRANPTLRAEIASYDCLMLKSCYSASAIGSEGALAHAKSEIKDAIGSFWEIKSDLRIQYVTPPPRRRWLTSRADANRATRFCDWATTELSAMGVTVLDLHSILSENGVLAKKYCRCLPIDQHPNDRGSLEGLGLLCSSLNQIARRSSR